MGRIARVPLWDRSAGRRLGFLALTLLVLGGVAWLLMIRMPGRSHRGPLPPLSAAEHALAAELRRDLTHLAGAIGERNVYIPRALAAATDWLEAELAAAGYRVERQGYEVLGTECHNLEVTLPGTQRPHEAVVIGAHYDSVSGSPGANDNGTGTVATLALARAFAGRPQPRTLRFVLFVNEEPPFFWTGQQGSLVYARRCQRRGDRITAMLSLETIGCYRDEPETQRYPGAGPISPLRLFYPTTGNFITFVGDTGSADLVRQCVGSFRRHARFPSEGLAAPAFIEGVGWSDHWSFWQAGYAAAMVTDTATFRDPHYHTAEDTPDQVDYERMARVVSGLEPVVRELAAAE